MSWNIYNERNQLSSVEFLFAEQELELTPGWGLKINLHAVWITQATQLYAVHQLHALFGHLIFIFKTLKV